MKIKFTLIAVILFFASNVLGQQYVDLLNIQHSQSIGKVDAVSLSKTSFTESTIDLLIPIQLDSSRAIITGAVGERTYFNDRTGNPILVYGLMLKAGMNIKHEKNWSGSYILLPRIASDKIEFNSKRFQLGGLILMKRIYSEAFNFKFGVYSNSEYFSPFIVPVAGFYFQKNRWEMNVTMPISADLNYTVKKNLLAVGFRYNGFARSYFRYNTANRYIEKANNEVDATLASTASNNQRINELQLAKLELGGELNIVRDRIATSSNQSNIHRLAALYYGIDNPADVSQEDISIFALSHGLGCFV